jgi:bacterioferritin-associated ferredoxin
MFGAIANRSHREGKPGTVIVCVCNNLNCSKVREAVEAGASSCAKVYLHHGVRPQCGRCVDTVRGMLPQGARPRVQGAEEMLLSAEMAAE